METKQTAVQWLFKNARLNMSVYDWLLCIEHAEEMEKEQIMKAYLAGESDGDHLENSTQIYYNETYGQ
jgi:hypothetical protein